MRSRIQRYVHATKTYSIILLSALISSRQLIERRDEKKRNPLCISCVHLLLFIISLFLCLSLIYIFSVSVSLANLSAHRRPLVAARELLEHRLCFKGRFRSSYIFAFQLVHFRTFTFSFFFRIRNCFHFPQH